MAVTGESSRLRMGVVAIVAISLFSALFARLWYLQVMNAPAYSQVAERNSTVTLPIPAPRGRLLDRNGNVLVDNVPSVVVSVDRQALDKVKEKDAVLSRLAGLLNQFEHPTTPFTLSSIKKKLAGTRVGPYDPVPLSQGVSKDLQVYLVEHASDFPSVLVQNRLLRQYHYGTSAAQVLGYVGPISDATWKAHEHDPVPYQRDDQVGRAGVEQSFERYLRGTPGKRVVEVDRAGRVVRTVSVTEPVAGDDVYLSIDINAQVLAETTLVAQLEKMRNTPAPAGYPPAPAGSAVLLDPSDGQVLALASYPSYDPSVFVPSISPEAWAALNDPKGQHPFTNRAVAGLYSPGSTFKLATALAALKAGLITPGDTINDPGYWDVQHCTGGQCRKYNDQHESLGSVALPRALTKSSDVYFYRVGDLFWQAQKQYGQTPIQDMATQLGLGHKTGIELPEEQASPLPTPALRKELHDKNPTAFPTRDWFTGDNLNLAIGQGDVNVTPLELAGAYGQFAVGGNRYRPTLLYKVTRAWSPTEVVAQATPQLVGHVDIDPSWQAAMDQGFAGVVGPDGTAGDTFAGFPFDKFPVAGKTGTAEVGSGDTAKFSNGFFVGFGPVPAVRYVGTAVLEQSGYGATAAAPVVRALLEAVANGGFPVAAPTIPVSAPPAPASTTTTVPGGAAPAGTGGGAAAAAPDQTTPSTDSASTGIVGTGGTR